jgi:tRNA threonylcarbamoyl adenosine modification protein YeaZ
MWLAIETATDRASVAIGLSESDVVETEVTGARRHAAALLPAIAELLRRRGASLDDLGRVALADGPGSFTGLRVGATAAKALARARHLPLRTAPSLMARAAGVAAEPGSLVLAVSDALRGEVYAGAFRFDSGGVRTELEPGVQRPESLATLGLSPAVLVGDAPAAVRDLLERSTGLSMITPPEGAPRATALLGLAGMEGGARELPDPPEWEPFYGRPAEAQARWEIAHGRPLPDPTSGAR